MLCRDPDLAGDHAMLACELRREWQSGIAVCLQSANELANPQSNVVSFATYHLPSWPLHSKEANAVLSGHLDDLL